MIGLCPECHESIRVPVGGEELEVRCPLCNATYSLGKVLQSLPPSLEIVGSPGVDLRLDDSSQGIGPRVSIDVSTGTEPNLAAEGIRESASPYRPQKRTEVNAFTEIIKVILGGVVAMPIGVLCVWWFAGKAPFGLSDTVSRYVPWIVPADLRSPAEDVLGIDGKTTGGGNTHPLNRGNGQETGSKKFRVDEVEANRKMFQADRQKREDAAGELFVPAGSKVNGSNLEPQKGEKSSQFDLESSGKSSDRVPASKIPGENKPVGGNRQE